MIDILSDWTKARVGREYNTQVVLFLMWRDMID